MQSGDAQNPRQAAVVQTGQVQAVARKRPSASEIETEILSLPCPPRESAVVDVIVPIYRSIEESLSCLLHVLRQRYRTPYDLVVIDDCSPEPELSAALRRIATSGHITLLRNEQNLGFVKTCNRGLALNPDRDVVLLNSDTETYGDWLDRIVDVAKADPGCSTVTPLTNNGEICSYPNFVKDNPDPLEIPYAELDRLCAEVNHGRTVRAPTGVGFCMFVKREVLNKVGFLDADTFGRGYGEENDLCLRGQAAGYHDLIAGGIFVRHLGSVSFQGEKSELIRKNLAILNARWPNYHRDVMRYLDEDPVRALRASIDLGRLKLQRRRRNVMIISHYDRGGGSEQAVQEEIDRLTREGVGVYRLRSVSAGEQLFHMHPHVDPAPNIRSLHLYSDMDEILSLWSDLKIDEVHIHHLIDFGPDGVRHITTLLERYGRPYRFVLHDYFPICPRIHLHQSDGFYCGEPVNASTCNQCLISNGSPFGGADIEAWREDYRRLFAAADMLIAPDADVVNRMQRYFRGDNYYVRPHEHVQIKSVTPSAPVVGRPIRVVTLGAISDIKGFHVLLGCAEHARHHSLPIEFHVVGYTMDDAKAKAAGVSVSGPYDGDFALEALLVARPDVVLLGAVWPETYSYTLTVALRSGLPTWVFDIGAPARRLREAGVGKILPLSMARNYRAINEAIMAEFSFNA